MIELSNCIDPRYSTTRLVAAAPSILSKAHQQIASQMLLSVGDGRNGEGGLRTKGHFKKSYERLDNQWCVANGQEDACEPVNLAAEYEGKHLPLITVITVVFNGGQYLEKTIQSVINQTYPNVEYIIIDGGSTDGTLGIIRKYEHAIDYWVSEKDKGIYNAMNKGLVLAAGDYVWYMNCGDTIHDPDVLARVLGSPPLFDFYYGDTQVMFPDGEFGSVVKAPKKLTVAKLEQGMVVSHQSFIVSRRIAPLYNENYRLIADLAWLIKIIEQSQLGKNAELTLSSYQLGGISEKMAIRCVMEKASLMKERIGGLRYYWLLFSYSLQIFKIIVNKVRR